MTYPTSYIFLMLVAYCHDMVLVSGLRDRGIVHGVGPVAHSMEEAVDCVVRQLEDDTKELGELILQDEEDGEMRWLNGISVQVNNTHERIMRKYRQVQEMLDHDIENLARGNSEVKEWLDSLGGITKLNEKLCGQNLSDDRGWYRATQRYFKKVLGHLPPAFGQPTKEHADSATNYGGYAVNVHRTMVNRKAYGEVPDMEGENDWATTETEMNFIPGWYRRLVPSQTLLGVKMGAKRMTAAQQIAKCLKTKEPIHRLRPVICVGPNLGQPPFTNVHQTYTDSQVDRNPDIQKLMYRFKNEPWRMLWKKVFLGNTDVQTWVAGVRTTKGQFVWLSLSKESNQKFDYFTNNGENVQGFKINFLMPPAPKGVTYDKYNLVKGHMSIRTKKVRDGIRVIMEATKDYPDCRGKSYMQIVKISDEVLEPEQWGARRKRFIKQGWESVRVRKGTFQPKDKEMEI